MTMYLLFRGASFPLAQGAATSSLPVPQKQHPGWQVVTASAQKSCPGHPMEVNLHQLIPSFLRGRNHLCGNLVGGSFCFNEAKVASTFVCAWLQSDSDLSRAESKFRILPRNHVSLPTSLWWMLSPHQISLQWLPQRDLCRFPKSKPRSIHSSKSLELSPSPPILSWTRHMGKKYRQVLFLHLNLGSVPCFSGINWILKITI